MAKQTKSSSAAPKKTATPKAAAAKAKPAAKAAAPAEAPAARRAPAKKPVAKALSSGGADLKFQPSTAEAEKFRALEMREAELPLEYGDTKVVLLSRDPEWIFAWWEINAPTRKKFGIVRGASRRPLVLRLFEVEGQGSSAGTSRKYTDTPVNDSTSTWYVRVPKHGARYRAQLGVYDEKGDFLAITSSNEIDIPRMGISEKNDVEFATISDDVYSQIVELSGGMALRERLGSDEFLHTLQQRVFDSLTTGPFSSAGMSSGSVVGIGSSGVFGLSSGMFGGSSGGILDNLSSGALTTALFSGTMISGGGAGDTTESRLVGGKRRDFWLEVGVDVIVYGATEPDAKVIFMGQEIRLTPDGTFRVRMTLPDTTIEFPIAATSADGEETRKVKPVVKRHTEGDPRKPV